eukprot:1159381-Pelagomonas_calceolata.AAC.1
MEPHAAKGQKTLFDFGRQPRAGVGAGVGVGAGAPAQGSRPVGHQEAGAGAAGARASAGAGAGSSACWRSQTQRRWRTWTRTEGLYAALGRAKNQD